MQEDLETVEVILGCIDEAHQSMFGNLMTKRYGHF